MKIKKGDNVKVVAGKDKGKTGKVEKTFPKVGKVLVLGVNQYKRHVKASQNKPSEIATITKPLPIAAIQLICPKCNLPTRVGYVLGKTNKKERICKKCQQHI